MVSLSEGVLLKGEFKQTNTVASDIWDTQKTLTLSYMPRDLIFKAFKAKKGNAEYVENLSPFR